MVFFRLNAIPAENCHGHGIDTGLLHQADVIVPHVFRPLVRIVVTTVCDALAVIGQQFRPFEGLAIGVTRVTSIVEFFGFVVFFALIIAGPHVLTFPNILDTTVYLLTMLYNRCFCDSVNFDCVSDNIPIHPTFPRNTSRNAEFQQLYPPTRKSQIMRQKSQSTQNRGYEYSSKLSKTYPHTRKSQILLILRIRQATFLHGSGVLNAIGRPNLRARMAAIFIANAARCGSSDKSS